MVCCESHGCVNVKKCCDMVRDGVVVNRVLWHLHVM